MAKFLKVLADGYQLELPVPDGRRVQSTHVESFPDGTEVVVVALEDAPLQRPQVLGHTVVDRG